MFPAVAVPWMTIGQRGNPPARGWEIRHFDPVSDPPRAGTGSCALDSLFTYSAGRGKTTAGRNLDNCHPSRQVASWPQTLLRVHSHLRLAETRRVGANPCGVVDKTISKNGRHHYRLLGRRHSEVMSV